MANVTITIPDNPSPVFTVTVNNKEYTYPSGTDQSVPDYVAAAIIDSIAAATPRQNPPSTSIEDVIGFVDDFSLVNNPDGSSTLSARSTDGTIKTAEIPFPELPVVSSTDNGKVLAVVAGEWAKSDIPDGNLPVVSAADNGKVLAVKNGAWASSESELDDFAKIDGAYEGLTAGNAEQLISSVAAEDKVPYNFRTAGGSTNIGNRKTEKIVGGTVAWNQLVAADATSVTLNSERKYFTRISGTESIVNGNNASVSVNGETDNVFDLTQMFGTTIANYIYSLETANAGAGVAWFKKYYPKDYYANDYGTLRSVNTSKHITTDVNITDLSFAGIKKIVSAGLAPKLFKVRDQITCTKNGVTLAWDILGFDIDKSATNPSLHTMTLGLHDCFSELQFDAREALFYFVDGLAAGTYNFTVKAHTWVSGDVNKTFQFTLTQAIPAKGQLVLGVAYDVTIANSTAKTYSGAASATAIETVTITEGSGGTSLGDVNSAISGGTNSLQRALLGNNNYSQSALRQYLNSKAAAGSVWSAKNVWDRAPSWKDNTAGFLNGMDEDFLSVIGEVTKKTALNTVSDGGGSETTTEKFFLLSRSEVYGGNEVTGGEGAAYPYYSDYSDLGSAGTGNDTNRIKYRNGTAKYWWLRSPYADYASNVRYVHTAGNVSNFSAISSYGVAPACCIVGDDNIEEHEYPLDSSLELRGIPKLDTNNNLYYDGDIYESSGKVTRKYRLVDLGNERWQARGDSVFHLLDALPNSDQGPFAILCPKYITNNVNSSQIQSYDKVISSYPSYQPNCVMIRDTAYADADAATFKAAMSGVYLLFELATPTKDEIATPFTNPQIVSRWGTEEYVDYEVSQGTRDVAIPVGHDTLYQANLRAKLEMSPDLPDGNGDFIVRQTNGLNEYVPLVIPAELPSAPTTDGTYHLKLVVSDGTATLSWEVQS